MHCTETKRKVKQSRGELTKIFKDIPISLVTSDVLMRRRQFDQTKDLNVDLINNQKRWLRMP